MLIMGYKYMMIDLTPIKENDNEFGRIVTNVSTQYVGAWDDPIHDSYRRYVNEMEEYAQRVHAVKCRAESLQKEVEGLRIDEMLEKAQRLCREAENI